MRVVVWLFGLSLFLFGIQPVHVFALSNNVGKVALGGLAAGGFVWANNRLERVVDLKYSGCPSLLAAVALGAFSWKQRVRLQTATYPFVLASLIMGVDALRLLKVFSQYTVTDSFDYAVVGSTLFGLGFQGGFSKREDRVNYLGFVPLSGLFVREVMLLIQRYKNVPLKKNKKNIRSFYDKKNDEHSTQSVVIGEKVFRVVVANGEKASSVYCVGEDLAGHSVVATKKLSFAAGKGNWVYPFIYQKDATHIVYGVIVGCADDSHVFLTAGTGKISLEGALVGVEEECCSASMERVIGAPLVYGCFENDPNEIKLNALHQTRYRFRRYNSVQLSDGSVVHAKTKLVKKDDLECGSLYCLIDGLPLDGGIDFFPATQEHRIFLFECEGKNGFWLVTINSQKAAKTSKLCFVRFDKSKCGAYAHNDVRTFFADEIDKVDPWSITQMYEQAGEICVTYKKDKKQNIWRRKIPRSA